MLISHVLMLGGQAELIKKEKDAKKSKKDAEKMLRAAAVLAEETGDSC